MKRIKRGVYFRPVTTQTRSLTSYRAYIAASRRSDRSLEARVESARRASEIHKRRTGRSLRVTEQDVINEEMYEEEDDDLPLHYRRLTAHLQTGSVDFNRRLAAYLTNQVAMRSAMDQMINSSYAQQYPNAPHFAHNNPMASQSSSMPAQPKYIQSPTHSYRSAPYPSPHQADFRNVHARANSVASPTDFAQSGVMSPTQQQPPSLDMRRMSMPAPASASNAHSPNDSRTSQAASTPQAVTPSYPPLWQDHSMFTTTLPPESQQMLAPALDPSDPLTASLMAGSEHFLSSSHYPWATHQETKFGSPTLQGMTSTLAPSALAMSNELMTATSSGQAFDPNTVPSSGIDFNLSQDSSQLKGMSPMPGSGQVTPGETFWDSYIQDPLWNQDTTAS